MVESVPKGEREGQLLTALLLACCGRYNFAEATNVHADASSRRGTGAGGGAGVGAGAGGGDAEVADPGGHQFTDEEVERCLRVGVDAFSTQDLSEAQRCFELAASLSKASSTYKCTDASARSVAALGNTMVILVCQCNREPVAGSASVVQPGVCAQTAAPVCGRH